MELFLLRGTSFVESVADGFVQDCSSGLHIIKNFSQRQRLHLLEAQLYGFAHFRVFHFIVKSILLRFNSQNMFTKFS